MVSSCVGIVSWTLLCASLVILVFPLKNSILPAAQFEYIDETTEGNLHLAERLKHISHALHPHLLP